MRSRSDCLSAFQGPAAVVAVCCIIQWTANNSNPPFSVQKEMLRSIGIAPSVIFSLFYEGVMNLDKKIAAQRQRFFIN